MQGEPRSTHDIDMLIVLPPNAIGALVAAFPSPSYLLQESTIREAVANKSMFNLLSLADGEKVDFWILTPDPFDQMRFARKKMVQLSGISVNVSAPEDTILAKLRWSKLSGGSEKQLRDALRVLEVQGNSLDASYLKTWAKCLDVEELWLKIVAEAKIV